MKWQYMVIWLIGLIDMIGRSISTIAFDAGLVVKMYTIILFCILYVIREWNIASYGDNSWLLCVTNTQMNCPTNLPLWYTCI